VASDSKASKKPSAAKPPLPLTPAQTRDWVQTYGRHSRIYSWLFFALVLPLIFGVIWWELGEVNEDLIYSFGFAALVFFLLAFWSRKRTRQGWAGIIEEKFLREARVRRCGGRPDEIVSRPMARVRTERGRVHTLRLSPPLYDYFLAGEGVFKVGGLEWPEKTNLDRAERVCLACGNRYDRGTGCCPRCVAPEPDHQTLRRLTEAG